MRCILKKDMKCGARVFYYRYLEPEVNVYDKDFVMIYADSKMEKFILGCHIFNIIPIDDSFQVEKQFGYEYLSLDDFKKVRELWEH